MANMEPFLRRVTYCCYGTPYRKETAFWTNLGDAWKPKRCTAKHPCQMCSNGRHPAIAQQGTSLKFERIACFSRNELYRIPAALCDELAMATEIRISEILQRTEEALEARLERGWDRLDPTLEPEASGGYESRGQRPESLGTVGASERDM